MAIYRYKPGSLINEVQILSNDSGGRRAFLFARADATPEQLEQIKTRLTSMGWKAVPALHDGRPALEVRGFKTPPVMEQALRANGWVVEPPTIEAQENDRISTKEMAGNRTLKTAGLTYLAGDAAYMTYALGQYRSELSHMNRTTNFFNKLNIGAGIGYGLGSLTLLFFGSRDQSQNTIQNATRKINGYLYKEGLQGTPDSSLHNMAKDKPNGLPGRVAHTLAKYPSEVLNAVYIGVGGLLAAASSYRAVEAHRIGDIKNRNIELMDIGLGAVTAASAFAGLAIKEQKREEGEERRKGIGGIIDWITEKPLRATGYGFMVATGIHGVATYKKYQEGDPLVRKYAKYRAAFVGLNIVSEILMTLSSKGHGAGVKPDESIDKTVIAGVAETLSHYDEPTRERLIDQLAGFMASREVLSGRAEDHAAELRTQIAALGNNPWHAASKQRLPVADGPLVTPEDVVKNAEPEKPTPGTKVAGVQHAAMLAHASPAVTPAV